MTFEGPCCYEVGKKADGKVIAYLMLLDLSFVDCRDFSTRCLLILFYIATGILVINYLHK